MDDLALFGLKPEDAPQRPQPPGESNFTLGDAVPRDPNYNYGALLPYRQEKGMEGSVMRSPTEWNPAYSDTVKGLWDAFTAPGRATQGQETGVGDALNLGLATVGGGAAVGPKAEAGDLAMNLFHGSRHKFPPAEGAPLGKLDSEKIGTGEGAQAYGHGHYLAQSPGVAKNYQTAGSTGRSIHIGDAPLDSLPIKSNEARDLVEEALHGVIGHNFFKTKEEYLKNRIKAFDRISKSHVTPETKEAYKEAANVIRSINSEDISSRKVTGHIYTADLNDELIPRFLDLDKPFKEQSPHVQEAMTKIAEQFPKLPFPSAKYAGIGHEFYDHLVHTTNGNRAEATTLLRKHGILGNRFLDQQSRSYAAEIKQTEEGLKKSQENVKLLSRAVLPDSKTMLDAKKSVMYFENRLKTIKAKGTYNYVIFPGSEEHAPIINRED